jgi:predicted membrane-bound spermidine synthase
LSSPSRSSIPWPHLYLGVALTTLATLLLELTLTRIFSVVFYYHFAFLAISIALFGLGVGGVFSYVVAGWKAPLFRKLGHLSTLNSLFVLVSVGVVITQREQPGAWGLAMVYFGTSLPFFVSGTIVSLAISETVERVDRVYFFDLLGAATGCILLVPFLNHFGGPRTVIFVAVFFAAAGAIWHSMAGSIAWRAASVALALALFASAFFSATDSLIAIRYAKGQKLKHEDFVQWNSFSRIAVRDYLILIDADASTGIASFDFEHLSARDRHLLLEDGPALPYVLRPGAKTLVIGPGGGWDVARALASGSHDITGVEINPIIATTVMRERFAALSRGIYLRPDVHIYIEDGRSFVRRSREKYQVLQATLVDTWASTAAGAFALSENNLYTTDALRDYLLHLTDDGVAAFTRWGLDPPRESLRLVSLAMAALRQLGETEPWRHIIVGRDTSPQKSWGSLDTVLISRKPFPPADLDRARAAMAAAHMQPVYLPDERLPNQFTDLLRSPDPAAYQRHYQYDISPVSDNRPFFFYSVQPRDVLGFLSHASRTSADFKINRAVPLLYALMAISVLATAIILALPPMLLRTRLPTQNGVRAFLLYLVAIGAGYILIEVALIQKFVLFLGHPTYALTVVIFSLLVSSGLGSYSSRRILGDRHRRLYGALLLIAVLVALLAAVVTPVLAAGVGLPLVMKFVITVLLISPAGFVMGMPFPTGLKRLEAWHKPSVRWAWSLNAAASVLGSVGALVCGIYLGLVQTLLAGGLLYLAALTVVALTPGVRHDPVLNSVPLAPAPLN